MKKSAKNVVKKLDDSNMKKVKGGNIVVGAPTAQRSKKSPVHSPGTSIHPIG